MPVRTRGGRWAARRLQATTNSSKDQVEMTSEDAVRGLGLVPLDEAVVAGGRLEGHPGPLGRHARQNDCHPPGTLEAEHVGVVHHPHQLLPLRRTVLRAERRGKSLESCPPSKVVDGLGQDGLQGVFQKVSSAKVKLCPLSRVIDELGQF